METQITNIHGDNLYYHDHEPLIEYPITCGLCKNQIENPIETLSLINYMNSHDQLNIESIKIYFCDGDCQKIYQECPF